MTQEGTIWFKIKNAPPGFILMHSCTKGTEVRLRGPFVFGEEKINKGIPVPIKDLERLTRILSKWGIRYEAPNMDELNAAFKKIGVKHNPEGGR